ncbi:DUF2284 domain-containing protein [Desulfatibacillum aliphaticivorans]|uniref:DUF2284 domain-containing protein n=1 Tax=Desulfatibacillum aliphaticivorans TaxID=218208 RepID=UPI0004159980|nr:DUF2284 domain-containing protein [Desulfatibacillum aliphaticivorans]
MEQKNLTELQNFACELGADSAVLLDATIIDAKENLAALCQNPRCPNYGVAASCPPHVGGPESLKKQLPSYTKALFFRLMAKKDDVYSSKIHDIQGQVHTIAASLENRALELGFDKARAFAGGSCKNMFCADQPDCNVTARNGACRNPDLARPSMSGYGIDVSALAKAADWPPLVVNNGAAGKEDFIPLYGLLIVG